MAYIFQTLIEHMEEQNPDGFTDAVRDYDSISRLDQWFTSILLRIKKQVNDNPDLRWKGYLAVVRYVCVSRLFC